MLVYTFIFFQSIPTLANLTFDFFVLKFTLNLNLRFRLVGNMVSGYVLVARKILFDFCPANVFEIRPLYPVSNFLYD